MRPNNKRLLTLLIMAANVVTAFAQSVFSVEKISKTEYFQAEKERLHYNVIPTDSIVNNDIVDFVLKECRAKFERLDSTTRQDIYEIIETRELVFDKQSLLYLPELKLYGFIIPVTPFETAVWWFDSESGKYICSAAYPTAINANGMYVSQVGGNCDMVLELKFFRREGDTIYEFASYTNTQYDGETIVYQEESTKHNSIFWYGNNMLFLKTYDYKAQAYVYLKIKIQ